MACDLALLERWLNGWSRSRGLPLPVPDRGGLRVDVGWPDQLRRHVFVDAGAPLQACAAGVDAPHVFFKAAVDSPTLRRALPSRWSIEAPRFLMACTGPMAGPASLPDPLIPTLTVEHGAYVIALHDADGAMAATGRITFDAGTAVYDRIETAPAHRRNGLASYIMLALDDLAIQSDVTERLLVATSEGATLYRHLGWHHVAPFSTATLTRR